jgi:pyruvate formate lyase activating enzyme
MPRTRDKPMLQIKTPTIDPPGPLLVPSETVRVLGWARTTLLDYPGKVASTLFLPGCNYRCPYCHNPELIYTSAEDSALFRLEEIYSYVARYANMLEGVCITGGEPLLQAVPLAGLCRRIKDLGLRVKLDTNGSMPERLEALLDENLLDYVAVDIKGPPLKIQSIARAAARQENLVIATKSTVDLLTETETPFELRTTWVPGLLDPPDFHAIGQWMRGAPLYVVQQFRPGKTLDPLFEDIRPHPPAAVHELCQSLSESGYFSNCTVRGIG